jgi:hypothetical protein
VEAVRDAYLLTYTPPSTPVRTAGEIHRIRVETTRPGVTLHHRTLYRQRSPQEQIAGQLLARLLYSTGSTGSPSTLQLVGTKPGAAGSVRARFRLQLPLAGLTLVDRGELRQGAFSVLVAVADERGHSSPVRQALVPVIVAKQGAAQDHFAWEVEIPLQPGKHRLGLAWRDELAGELSFLVREFEVAALGR